MTTVRLKSVAPATPRDIPVQPASVDIWDKKYRLKTKAGRPLDQTVDETYQRVAKALAEVEATPALSAQWEERFLWALRRGAIPAGRIVSNAGALAHKPATSTINCTVSGTIHDSMDDILRKVHEGGLTLKAGCGIGYCFSTLRPRGAYVSGAGAYTSGPLSFMDIFDKMCFTVSSAGGRRGAQMGTFDVCHPDVMEFIRAKRENGRLRQFNLSLLITEAFIDAVRNDKEWLLYFPILAKEAEADNIDLRDSENIIWRDWPIKDGFIVDHKEHVACKIYSKIKARKLWNLIMSSTYDFAEPGFILVDRINNLNNNWFCEDIRATNPCVTADTRLHTQHGIITVGELYANRAELEVTVDCRSLGKDQLGVETRPAVPVFMTSSEADVYRVVTRAGYEIKATKWHELYTTDGKKPLHQLKLGDDLLIQSGEGQFGSEGSHPLGQLIGLITGDGHFIHRGAGEEAAVVNPWGEDRSLAEQLAAYLNRLMAQEWRNARHHPINPVAVPEGNLLVLRSFVLARLLEHHGFTKTSKFSVPEVVWRGTRECVRGYLRGLFQVDGTVDVSSNRQSCSIRLASSHRSLLTDVQMLLVNFGVLCRIHPRRLTGRREFPDGKGGSRECDCHADYELVIDGESRERFMERIGFLLDDKTAPYGDWVNDRVLCKTQRFTSEVVAIEHVGREAVFDTTQKDHNCVIFNGIVSGQCGEQPLPPYGSCWTGNMRLNTDLGLIRTEDAHAMVRRGHPLQIAVDHEFTGNKTQLRPCTLVENGTREVFEVAFKNGQRIELTAYHRVYTPGGWREVRELAVGDKVNVQAQEMDHLTGVPPFYIGVLRYCLGRYNGDAWVITRQNRRAFLKPILDRLHINYRDRAEGLFLSRYHPALREVEAYDLSRNDPEVHRGMVYAAHATGGRYKGKRALYGDLGVCQQLAASIALVTEGAEQPVPIVPSRVGTNHGKCHHGDTYRLILPDLDIRAPELAPRRLNLEYALYGWLLGDGWLTDSMGVLFSDQDDGAMELLAPQFTAMTGTGGAMGTAYEGQQRTVYSLACYRQDAIRRFRDDLGLDSYLSKDIRVPEKVFRADSDAQASFLAAVFGADGTIDDHKLRIRLVSASKAWLQDIQLLLLNFGIHGRIHSGISKGDVFYSLILNQGDGYRYFRHIGFPFNSHKQARLERLLDEKQRWHEPGEHVTEEVASIRSLGEQTVYDIEEYSTHTLIVNGVVVHNCLLGSVNLTKFVLDPFTEKARFDWDTYRDVVAVFTRMLDNVVEINGLPLGEQRHEIVSKRRHGMGYIGLGSTLTMLRMKYGQTDSLKFTEEVSREMALAGWQVALEMAKEKGPAPILEQDFTVTEKMLMERPEMAADGFKVGDKVKGKVLHARYSRYMQRVAEVAPDLVNQLAEVGARFTHHTSIAPTGTISLSLANNASNGIEPSFAHYYARNIIREGRKTKEKVDVYSFELLAYRELVNPKAMPDSTDPQCQLPTYFTTADDVTPEQHVDIQAAAQRWVDSSISKTANVPTDYPFESFKNIYLYAHEKGLKGCTTFRFNPEAFQGVLVKEKDLENTTYRFELDDGTTVEVKGNEEVEYDGERHTAANLFDALKEGYYGRL
ncbi:MAG: LAGLIDADG family homing endonuclease [Candidatus Competibacterales bacterium]